MTEKWKNQNRTDLPLKNTHLYRGLFCSVHWTGYLSTLTDTHKKNLKLSCQAEGTKSIPAALLRKNGSAFQFYNWTYIILENQFWWKNIDGL